MVTRLRIPFCRRVGGRHGRCYVPDIIIIIVAAVVRHLVTREALKSVTSKCCLRKLEEDVIVSLELLTRLRLACI